MWRQLKKKWNVQFIQFIDNLVFGLIALLTVVGGILVNLVSSNPLSALLQWPWPLPGTLLVVVTLLLLVLQRWKDRLPKILHALSPSVSPWQRLYSPPQRRYLLKKVQAKWIKEVLKPSLHNTSNIISLDFQEQPDAIVNSQQSYTGMQQNNQPPHLFPAGTRISEVFEQAEDGLLILGESGCGKTTILLELTRDLLGQAEHDDSAPVPVVFPLSSWAEKELPLAEWFVEELSKYDRVSPENARTFVEGHAILPLLDGLDQVPKRKRAACVRAINTYHQTYMGSFVLSSRPHEYFAQEERLAHGTAVMIQPLKFPQIDEYLEKAGKQWEPLRSTLQDNKELQDLVVEVPLMLSFLMELSVQGKDVEQLRSKSSWHTFRQAFLDSYTGYVFKHRENGGYTFDEMMRRLRWLAKQMQQHHLTKFSPEDMHAGWLPDRRWRQWYRLCLV